MVLRCVICSLRIVRIQRHRLSEESDEIMERVKRRVHPRDISGEDYMCHACWQLINRNHETESVPPRGHVNICLTCGKSILRTRSRMVLRDEGFKKEVLIQVVILEWIHPRQLQPSDKVCIPCWLKAKRIAKRRSQENREMETSNALDQGIQQEEVPEGSAGPSNALNLETNQEVPIRNDNIKTEPVITLPSLRRAAATARRCLFPDCNIREKSQVPDSIRKQMIVDYNFYIPINSRICNHHIVSNSYHELYTAGNALTTFTGGMIEDIVSLLREKNRLDFSQPENIDDRLFKYWFGYTKNEYNAILTEVPRLNSSKMKIGLNALLCKIRTGDSDERISALFQTPRRTLERYMQQAQDILLQDYGPNIWCSTMLQES